MRSRSADSSTILATFSVAIVTLFTIEQLRLFVSGLNFGLREARGVPAEVVGLVGFAIVALTLVSVVLVSSVNRGVVTVLVGGTVLVRLISQAVADPTLLLVVSAAGVVIAGLAFSGLVPVYGGRIVGVGLVMGGAFDVAVMASRHTLDLPRSADASAFLIVLAIGMGAIGSLLWERHLSGFGRYGPPAPAAAAFTIGPWLAVHLTVTGNLGFVGSVTGLGLAGATAVCALGSIMALAWVAPGRSAPQPAIAGALLVLALVLLIGADSGWAAFLVFIASISAGGVVTGAFERETTAPPRRVAWGVGGGMVVGFFGLIVIYFPLAGIGGLSSAGLLFLLGVPLFAAGLACIPHQARSAGPWPTPVLVAAAMLIVPLGVWMFERSPPAEDQVAGDPFILTFNLNSGFSEDGRLALESMARVIESTTPDIVALQEISRGWVATGGVDMVVWLEHRLGMPIIFAPTIDRQWGIAVATRLETSTPVVVSLGEPPNGLARAALDVPIEVSPDLTLRVIVAQLDQVEADVEARVDQTRALMLVWGGSANTLVVGDFGSGPSDQAIRELLAAGLRSPARLIPQGAATFPASAPTTQRDYILISPDLAPSAARVVPLAASDHLALLVRVGAGVVGG